MLYIVSIFVCPTKLCDIFLVCVMSIKFRTIVLIPLVFMYTFQHEEENETLAIWNYLYNKYKWYKQNMYAIRNILRCINVSVLFMNISYLLYNYRCVNMKFEYLNFQQSSRESNRRQTVFQLRSESPDIEWTPTVLP